MDKNKNYYAILGVNHQSTDNEIKKAYYKLSFQFHPDKNSDADPLVFNKINEAYNILTNNELRQEYDTKCKWGKSYNEYLDLFDINIDYSHDDAKSKIETFKKNEVWNIQMHVDDKFDGTLIYERWVKCKGCDGSGKDLLSKIVIKDANGNITKTFDADDGCDFCDGQGVDHKGNKCYFCQGKGKAGINPCKKCNGESRILGKQKVKVKLKGKETKLDTMGHYAKNGNGKVGYLLIIDDSITE